MALKLPSRHGLKGCTVGAFVFSNATRKLANNNNRTGLVMTNLTFAAIAGANTFSGLGDIRKLVGGTIVVASGGALKLAGNITASIQPLTLNGNGISSCGALRNISGTNSFGGLLPLGSNARINSDSGSGLTLSIGGTGSTRINSVLGTGTGGLVKDGAGTRSSSRATTPTPPSTQARSKSAGGAVGGGELVPIPEPRVYAVAGRTVERTWRGAGVVKT